MAIFPANATIVFSQASTPQTINLSGTPQVSVQPLIVVASLTQSSSRSAAEQLLRDVDENSTFLSGRAITPKALPNNIQPGTTGKCYLWRLTSAFRLPESFPSISDLDTFANANEPNIILSGVFKLQPQIGSRFKVQQILGDKISGSLSTQVAWDEIV